MSIRQGFATLGCLCAAALVALTIGQPVRADTGSPLAHLTFDAGSGTTAVDASGNGHDGSIVGGAPWTAGASGPWALSFDGVDDRVDVAIPAGLEPPSLTVIAWVKGTPAPGQVILAKGDFGCTGPEYGFVSTASGVRFDWRARETFAQVQVPMSIGGDDAIWDGEMAPRRRCRRWRHGQR